MTQASLMVLLGLVLLSVKRKFIPSLFKERKSVKWLGGWAVPSPSLRGLGERELIFNWTLRHTLEHYTIDLLSLSVTGAEGDMGNVREHSLTVDASLVLRIVPRPPTHAPYLSGRLFFRQQWINPNVKNIFRKKGWRAVTLKAIRVAVSAWVIVTFSPQLLFYAIAAILPCSGKVAAVGIPWGAMFPEHTLVRRGEVEGNVLLLGPSCGVSHLILFFTWFSSDLVLVH